MLREDSCDVSEGRETFKNPLDDHRLTLSTQPCCADYNNHTLSYESHTAPCNGKGHHCEMVLIQRRSWKDTLSAHTTVQKTNSAFYVKKLCVKESMVITLFSGDNMLVAMSPQPATSVLKKIKFFNVLYLL